MSIMAGGISNGKLYRLRTESIKFKTAGVASILERWITVRKMELGLYRYQGRLKALSGFCFWQTDIVNLSIPKICEREW